MTDLGTPATYRYVSDDSMTSGLNRDLMARVHLPVAAAALGLIGLGVGIYSSFESNRESLPYDRDEVMRIGVVWGLVFAALWIVAGLIGLVVARGLNRRRMRRLFPVGSATEVRLGEDALVLVRPATTRTIPYDGIRRVRRYQHTLWIVARARPFVEVLPADLLPESAVETLRARASAAVPLSWSPGPTGSVRDMVVPRGWASHVAAVTVRASLAQPRFWARLGLSVLVSGVIAYAAGPAWLGLGPALALLSLTLAFARTRAAVGEAMPSGSVASVEVLDDRLVSRTARWAREARFGEVRDVDVRSDVVLLTMTSVPRLRVLARELVPDEVIERLRAKA